VTVAFGHGNVVITRNCQNYLNSIKTSPLPYLYRHLEGDWGDVDKHDKLANDEALKHGSRLFSVYRLNDRGDKLWIITDAEDDQGVRRVTTVMLPEDY